MQLRNGFRHPANGKADPGIDLRRVKPGFREIEPVAPVAVPAANSLRLLPPHGAKEKPLPPVSRVSNEDREELLLMKQELEKLQRRITALRTIYCKVRVELEKTRIPIELIQTIVARYFSTKFGKLIRVSDILASRRTTAIVRIRQIAMYLCKTKTLRSYPEIGRKFAGRDHTTILHSVRKIEALRLEDAALDATILALEAEIDPPEATTPPPPIAPQPPADEAGHVLTVPASAE